LGHEKLLDLATAVEKRALREGLAHRRMERAARW
jgi:hypothetical protein